MRNEHKFIYLPNEIFIIHIGFYGVDSINSTIMLKGR